MRRARAVAFDFNGTLSHDEPILYAVYRDMFAEHGQPLSESAYYGGLAGLSEETIIETWLGVKGISLEALVDERIERYLELAGRGETIPQAVRDAVAYAAERVPVAVVSGAFGLGCDVGAVREGEVGRGAGGAQDRTAKLGQNRPRP